MHAIVLISIAVTAVDAIAAEPEIILGRPRVGEYQPIRGEGWIAWQQNSVKHPRHYDVFIRPIDGGSRTRVNSSRTSGANGDIDDGVLVYQEFRRRRSGLRIFHPATGERTHPPEGVNTKHWEYWPSLSGGWLLFGRLYRNGTRSLFLFDLSTGEAERLARVRRRDAFLAPGQVSGDWVVWSRCSSDVMCNIFRYRISTGEREIIANRGDRRQRAPSVNTRGTVYYARALGGCGNRVRLMRQSADGDPEVLWRLPNGDDIGRTHAQSRPRSTTILYDQFSCGLSAQSDGWQIAG